MATMTMTAAAAAEGNLRGFRAALDLLATWRERVEQRRMLAAAGERIAMDLGVSQAELAAEAAKPFWRR